jgi:phenylalanine-4-hydroxylase
MVINFLLNFNRGKYTPKIPIYAQHNKLLPENISNTTLIKKDGKMAKKTNYVAKIPDSNGFIDYSKEEHSVWSDLFNQQQANIQHYAANEYLYGLEKLTMPSDRIPQCSEISQRLKPLTGWTVAPVPALISFGRFFKTLSEKTFPAASFIRNRADFDYIKEPDIFHEIFGHTPLLTDPSFAHFSETIGKIGLQVQSADYSWLIRLYWFTIEFGLIKKNGIYKALGSGLNSSPTELIYSIDSPVPERREFNVIDILRTPYRIDIHQPIYYVIDDIDDLLQVAERDLVSDIKKAQSLGLYETTYEST